MLRWMHTSFDRIGDSCQHDAMHATHTSPVADDAFLELAGRTDDHVRLEITAGLPTWEASPSYAHNDLALAIYESIRPTGTALAECGYYRAFDSYIRFDAQTLRRPDIAIFCTLPPRTRRALTLLPGAVIEILSPDSAEKDRLAVPIYLAAGVRDVLLVDPDTQTVAWHTAEQSRTYTLPYLAILQIGCAVILPRLDIVDA